MKTNIDRTIVVKNIIAINTIMKKYMKYCFAVLLLAGFGTEVWGVTYQKVTDVSQLTAGDQVILTNNMNATGSGYALSKTVSGQCYGCVEVSSSSNKITYTGSDIMVLTIKTNKTGTLYAFWNGSGFLYDDGTNNHLKVNSISESSGLASGADWVWQLALSSGTNPNKCIDVLNDKYDSGTDCPRYLQYNSSTFKSTKTYATYAQLCIWKVACDEPTLTLSSSSKTMDYGADGNTFTITKSTNSSGTITWSSSNTSVATVAKNGSGNGVVSVLKAGTAKISCTVGEYSTYCDKTVELNLTVNAVAPTLSHNTTGKALTVSSITSTGASFSGGIVTAKGGANITKYGFIVGTSSSVTYNTATAKADISGDVSLNTAFSSKSVTGLSPNTSYYVRAYAYNGSQYGYSTAVSFTTLQSYTISYDNNGGGGTIEDETKDHGATVSLNSGANFSKTGYNLTGWNTLSTGLGADYDLEGDYSANANVTLYAVWSKANYTITLNNQSATSAGTESITVTYDATTNLTGTPAITVPSKTGYTFGGYYTSTGGSGVQVIAANGNVNASANDGGSNTYTDASKNWKYPNNLILYAKWTANTISLTLDKNGGDSDGSATIKYDGTAVDASPTHAARSEWNLVGYYAEAGCTNKVLTNTGAVVNYTGYVEGGKWIRTTTPTTLYAKWSKIQYTVSFDLNGHGSSIDAQDVESGDPAIKPADPSEEDWRFLGWFTAADGGTAWNFSTGITGNTTLHAHWEAVEYSTTYKAWCDPDINITGNIHLTSTNGVAVYSTSTTSNLLNIQSDDLSGVNKLEIVYLDADNADAVVASSSSLFRVCNNGTPNYNVADETQIDVSAANTCDLNYSIRYTPSAHGVINHYKLQINMKRGTRTVKTVTHDLYGRSLPEEFVVASKFGGEWYALPNTLEATELAAKAVAGIKITVDNTTTPTKAVYAPSTAVYQGEGRYAANSHRYAIRLTDGTGHLQVSTSSDINKMWLSTTGSENCQDWWLSSTNFGAYSVTIPSVGTKKLGMYGGNIGYYADPTSPSEQIYFLPIENKLTENEAIVTEWGKKSVILDVDAQSAESAQARLGSGDPETAASFGQTLTSVKGGATKYNYTLSFNTMDFSVHKGELLYIDWLDDGGDVINTSSITIPWIIASSGAMHTIDDTKDHWNTEVHVLPGVTLEADGGEFGSNEVVVKQLEIYPGATVKVTKGSKSTGILTATNLVLRNGWTRAGEKNYDVARLYVTPSTATLKATHVYADWYIDYDRYYPIAVPWNVTVSEMRYKNNNTVPTVSATGHIRLQYYDGAQRADGGSVGTNWKTYGGEGNTAVPATLVPSQGYAMTAKRPTGKAFSIVRMPLALPSGSWGEGSWTTNGEQGEVSGTHKDQVTVTAHGANDTDKPWYAKGWNFIGNPYMASFNGNNSNLTGKVIVQGINGSIKYATIPNPNYDDYDQVRIDDGTPGLQPFTGFFVQIGTGGTLTFSQSNILAPAPSRYTNEPEAIPEQEVLISLNSENSKDQMGLIIGEDYTAEYEMNADLTKIMGEANVVKTWMRYTGMDMAYVAVNEELAKEWIPVTMKLPAGGEYTYSLMNSSTVGELEGVYLIDYETGVTTNLIFDDYVFTAGAGTLSNRFAINAIYGMRDTPTGADITDADKDGPTKFIYHDKVYILHNNVIYDSTGKRVNVINK